MAIDNRQPTIFPGFRYKDAPEAIEWLEKAFGFERHLVVPGENDTIAHAQLTFGNGMIMLGSAPAMPDPENPWDSAKQGIYVRVDDIDAHYQRARDAGADIVKPLSNTEYGSRAYTAHDPDGNVWTFGTYDPFAEHDS